MGWLKNILAPRRDPEAVARAAALSEVHAKWRAAVSAYWEAKANKDKRGMGEASQRARIFAHEAARLELGR